MPRAEATLPRPLGTTPQFGTAEVTGWGGGRSASVRLVTPERLEAFPAALEAARRQREARRGVIGRGMGRSYGDAAQREGGIIISSAHLKDLT